MQQIGDKKLILTNSGEVCSKMEQLWYAQSANKKIALVKASNSTYYLRIVNN